ncbi:TetR/AcrR family transcriptional regulator [Eubacteriales bacterium OttesenSCG-928-K08]|nr:TetR/AcrR family transcriptional regulator [Eubacteriales bacterium OttesenSCG-928-K08]
MEKTDRRVRYTKMTLRQALLELMQYKNVEQISVAELCRVADVNRGTFYAHFNTPQDLLRQVETEFLNALEPMLEQHSKSGKPMGTYEVVLEIVECIVRDSDLCKILLGKNGDTGFLRRVLLTAQQSVFSLWEKAVAPDQKPILEYLFTFIANGGVGVIQKWIEADMKDSPETIANVISTMANYGFQAFL